MNEAFIPATGGEPDPAAPDEPTTTEESMSARISVNHADLVAHLASIKPFVATKTSILPFKCVQLTHDGHSTLTIKANDNHRTQWATLAMPAAVINDSSAALAFDVAVEHAVFARIVKDTKGTTLVLDCQVTGDKRELIVGNSAGGAVIPSLAPEDMPYPPAEVVDKNKTWLHVERAFLDRLAQVRQFASSDETRQVICGVNVKVAGKKAVMSATNSYCLAAVQNVPLQATSAGLDKGLAKTGKEGINIRASFIDALLHATRKGKGELDWSFIHWAADSPGAGQLVVHDDKNTFGTTLIDGQFPNWVQLMPSDDDFTDTLGLDGATVHQALEDVKAQAGGRGKNWTINPVVLKAQAEEAEMTVTFDNADSKYARTLEHEAEWVMASDEPTVPLEAGVNPSFLDTFITAFDIKDVTMDFIRKDQLAGSEREYAWGAVLRPILITNHEDPDMTGLLMPIKLKD